MENEGKIVRIEIDSGGCHGFQYDFSLSSLDNLDPSDV